MNTCACQPAWTTCGSPLSYEVRQQLTQHRPQTLGQASRMSGVTPAAISLLLIHLKKNNFKGFATNGNSAGLTTGTTPGTTPGTTLAA